MRKIQSKRGRLGRILVRLFVASLLISVISVIVLIKEGDVTSTPEYQLAHSNSGASSKSNSSKSNSSSPSGASSGNTIGGDTSSGSVERYYLTTTSNLESAGSISEYYYSLKTVGSSITLTATANTGYTFVGWYDGDTKLSSNATYTFTMPAKNITYTAKFQQNSYTLSTRTNLSAAGTYTQHFNSIKTAGTSITLTATANTGYTFVGWYDGDTKLSSNATYTFTMPAKNITYTAKFQQNSYTLSTRTNLSAAGTYTQHFNSIKTAGTSVTLTATANTGYTFVGWYDGDTKLSSNATYTFTMPAKNITYTVRFQQNSYTLSTTSNLSNAGTYTQHSNSGKTFGSTITLTATANSGYTFVGWYDGDTKLSSNASYTFTMPAKDVEYEARYYRIFYSLTEDESSYATTGVEGFLQDVVIASTYKGKSVTSIGSQAFYDCTGLTSVTIPDSVTSIGQAAFLGCYGLTSVYITDLAAWCGISFDYNYANPLYYAHNLYLNGTLVTDLVIPNSVTIIGSSAFKNYSGLTSVTIPDSVIGIGDCAFYGCKSLTSITIPNSVTRIGECAFYGCTSLTSVTIGNSVTSIESRAFYGCTKLTSIIYQGTTSEWQAISKGSEWNYKTGDYTVSFLGN